MEKRREPDIRAGRFKAWISREGERPDEIRGPETFEIIVEEGGSLHEVRVYELSQDIQLIIIATRNPDNSITIRNVIDNPEDDKPVIKTLTGGNDEKYQGFVRAIEKRLKKQGQNPTLINHVSGKN